MFVHEYSIEEFNTYEECLDSLRELIETEDIEPHLDLSVDDILNKFLRRKTDEEFVEWLQSKIEEAITLAEDELITEYEEEEVE